MLSGCGSVGARMVAVVDAVTSMERPQAVALESAYWTTREAAGGSGVEKAWEQAFSYSRAFPEHPGDLYAIDPWSRAAFSYAGLVARERTWALGQGEIGIVPVERAATGAVLALSVDLAREQGWHHPVGGELADWLGRPWVEVMGPLTGD